MLGLFGELFRDSTTVLVFEQFGHTWFAAAALNGRSRVDVRALADRFVNSAVGVLRLIAGATGTMAVKSLNWYDPENPERRGGITLNLFSVRKPPNPTELLQRTGNGETMGAALIHEAEHDQWFGKVCSIFAMDGGWPRLYMLLELLKKHYAPAPRTSWDRAFKALSERHAVTVARLADLKQTANYYRHALGEPPSRPWELHDAQEFVNKALQLAVIEHLAGDVVV